MDTDYLIVLVTTASKAEATKIAQALLKDKLIACANIINPVTSLFHWKDAIDCVDECLVVMKSRIDLFGRLVEQVKGLHSYEVPEILALPVANGSADYLAWMKSVLTQ
ncbi:MAG: divalent-cation tolerance protein CutA [Candidatus Bathyarchaeota archaeon]|nr:divalent-cation tolerance protein CutA [Candidatus Bathyarchaeota archaeon]